MTQGINLGQSQENSNLSMRLHPMSWESNKFNEVFKLRSTTAITLVRRWCSSSGYTVIHYRRIHFVAPRTAAAVEMCAIFTQSCRRLASTTTNKHVCALYRMTIMHMLSNKQNVYARQHLRWSMPLLPLNTELITTLQQFSLVATCAHSHFTDQQRTAALTSELLQCILSIRMTIKACPIDLARLRMHMALRVNTTSQIQNNFYVPAFDKHRHRPA